MKNSKRKNPISQVSAIIPSTYARGINKEEEEVIKQSLKAYFLT